MGAAKHRGSVHRMEGERNWPRIWRGRFRRIPGDQVDCLWRSGMSSDRELGMDRPITRRDFLDGVALAVGGASLLAPNAMAASTFAQDRPGYDPPTLTGMRGSHDGSYDYSHPLRDPNFWKTAGTPIETGETYDLVVVGGGISG